MQVGSERATAWLHGGRQYLFMRAATGLGGAFNLLLVLVLGS
jgi:hypothetical protein